MNARELVIRRVSAPDRQAWTRLRDALWPGSLPDHDRETRTYFETPAGTPIVFVADVSGTVVGFLELDYRKYAPGCSSTPVPFIEGWFVDVAFRGRGIGRALVAAAEAHARAEGFAEIASDADTGNHGGIAAHRALGYDDIEHVVCFRKEL